MRVTDRRLAPRNVAAIVKQDAARLGFDPSTFGGHSLRAGFVTSAVKRGANLIKITDVTGHKSLEDAQDLRPRRRSLRRARRDEHTRGQIPRIPYRQRWP